LYGQNQDNESTNRKSYTILVAVDFFPCSLLALKKAKLLLGEKPGRILVLHVVDHDFIEKCTKNQLGSEDRIKKTLFLHAKARLQDLLRSEGMDEERTEAVVCEGLPCLEINKKAVEYDVDMIVMGSQRSAGNMKTIFFGSTAERVLRFIKRPVLCVPPEEGHQWE